MDLCSDSEDNLQTLSLQYTNSFLVAQVRVLLPNRRRPSRGVRVGLMKRMALRRVLLPRHRCRLPLLQAQEAVDADVALGEALKITLAEVPFAALAVEAALPVSAEQLGTHRSPVTCTEMMVRVIVLTLDCWHVLLIVNR